MTALSAFSAPPSARLADLPRRSVDGAAQLVAPELSAEDVLRVVDSVSAAGRDLAGRAAGDVAAVLGRAGARFLDPADPIRTEALERLPAASGLSPPMCRLVLDGMARDWTELSLVRLLKAELEDPGALDGWVTLRGRRVRAFAPRVCVQIVAGSVPGVGVTALVRGLLAKAPTLLKPGLGDVVLPVLFARALRETDPALAEALAVLYWPGGSEALEQAALESAELVVAYGSDATLAGLRDRTPVTTRFVAYHHRVSVGAVGRDGLSVDSADSVARDLAEAVAAFDQRGCVSPQLVYVENGGAVDAAGFAERLAAALAELEKRLPGGALDPEESASLHQLRGTAELLRASGVGGVWSGAPDASWTVILEDEPGPTAACAGRVLRVRPLRDLKALPAQLRPLVPHLQTLGLEGARGRVEEIATACGRLGISRVVPFREVAFPPPWWHHDGRGPLRELVRWAEMGAG